VDWGDNTSLFYCSIPWGEQDQHLTHPFSHKPIPPASEPAYNTGQQNLDNNTSGIMGARYGYTCKDLSTIYRQHRPKDSAEWNRIQAKNKNGGAGNLGFEVTISLTKKTGDLIKGTRGMIMVI